MPETGREISGLRLVVILALLIIAGGLYRYYRGMPKVANQPDGASGPMAPQAQVVKEEAAGEWGGAAGGVGDQRRGESTGERRARDLFDAPMIAVHVVGAVAHPGIYVLREGQRVADAIAAAGGATKQARLDLTNLAARLQDGQKVYIPSAEDAEKNPHANPWSDTQWGGDGEGTSTGGTIGRNLSKVNINVARLEDLDALPGIGPALAKRIIDYRQKHGPFKRLEDLQQVPGIGPAKFQELREFVILH